MTPFEQAIETCNNTISRYRRVLTLLHSKKMRELCENFSDEDWQELQAAAEQGNSYAVRQVLQGHVIKNGLLTMTIVELRELARSYQIPHYYRMYKDELLQEIAYVRRARSENGVVCENQEPA